MRKLEFKLSHFQDYTFKTTTMPKNHTLQVLSAADAMKAAQEAYDLWYRNWKMDFKEQLTKSQNEVMGFLQ